jgi:uncharacterized membrane protein YoaK (UPF0700 family)
MSEMTKPAAGSLRHPLAGRLLALTFTTGLVDAASYLGLGHVFTANMTGNVVLLGFGIAGSAALPVLAPVISLASFLLGAGAAAILARRREAPQPQDIARALSIEATAVGTAAVLAAVLTVRAGAVSGDIVIALLAFAMGVRNATVRRLAVPDLTTTVLTMTLTALAVESPLAGGTGAGSARRIAAVAAMFAGALAGALLLNASLALPLLATTALAMAARLTYVPAARHGA